MSTKEDTFLDKPLSGELNEVPGLGPIARHPQRPALSYLTRTDLQAELLAAPDLDAVKPMIATIPNQEIMRESEDITITIDKPVATNPLPDLCLGGICEQPTYSYKIHDVDGQAEMQSSEME